MNSPASCPTDADYKAADEVIALFSDIHVPTAGARERLAAQCNQQGESFFRLSWGLRSPTSFREELVLKRMAGALNAEQFRRAIRENSAQYLSQGLLDARYQELQRDLAAYGKFLSRCYNVVHERQLPFVEIDCDEAADEMCSQLDEKSQFGKDELEYLHGFIAEARIHHQAGMVQFKTFSAATCASVILLCNGTWTNAWKQRRQRRDNSALFDFCKACLDAFPRPQDLDTTLEHEFAIARLYLRHLQSANASPEMATSQPMTINVAAADVVLNVSTSSSDRDSASVETSRPLKVEYWSQLAIGIDEHGYWGLVPAPEFGGRFLKTKAVRLNLGGPRWKSLLRLLASSKDGETVTRIDLISAFDLRPQIDDLPTDFDDLDPDEAGQLNVRARRAYTSLNNALTELRERLRDFVEGPKGKGKTCLETFGDNVKAGFRVGYLLDSDDPGHYRFGDRK